MEQFISPWARTPRRRARPAHGIHNETTEHTRAISHIYIRKRRPHNHGRTTMGVCTRCTHSVRQDRERARTAARTHPRHSIKSPRHAAAIRRRPLSLSLDRASAIRPLTSSHQESSALSSLSLSSTPTVCKLTLSLTPPLIDRPIWHKAPPLSVSKAVAHMQLFARSHSLTHSLCHVTGLSRSLLHGLQGRARAATALTYISLTHRQHTKGVRSSSTFDDRHT